MDEKSLERKTMLEEMLEFKLALLGMPLEERIYREDMEIAGELDEMLNQEGDFLSEARLNLGEQPLVFLRRSALYKGLGFTYAVDAPKHHQDFLPTRRLADKIILTRDFGDDGGEFVEIYYSMSFAKKLRNASTVDVERITHDFYEHSHSLISELVADSESRLRFHDFNAPDKNTPYSIRSTLGFIHKKFSGRKITERGVLEDLIHYLGLLKDYINVLDLGDN